MGTKEIKMVGLMVAAVIIAGYVLDKGADFPIISDARAGFDQ